MNSRSYLGITCHYIDNYTTQALCLAVKEMIGSYTGDNIAAAIHEVLTEYEIQIEKVTSIVTDGAPNMVNSTR